MAMTSIFSDPFRDPYVPLAPEQLELRKLTLKQIETDPDGFDMSQWEKQHFNMPPFPFCRTTRCVAGWAQFLARGAVYEYGVYENSRQIIPPVDRDAIVLLGLTMVEYGSDDLEGTCGLFFMPGSEVLERMRELASVEL
jgi:hypothetical protein